MNIREAQKRAYAISESKGWHEDDDPTDPTWVAAKLALVHTEVSECVECARDLDFSARFAADGSGKPEGMPSELADVAIRVLDLAEALGIDLEEAIETKMTFNKTRTHRHGGRAL